MNDQSVHPIVRYGGPVLGALILYFVVSSMVGNFQAHQEEMRSIARETVAEAPAAEEAGASDAETDAATGDETADAGTSQEGEAEADSEDAANAEATDQEGSEATAEEESVEATAEPAADEGAAEPVEPTSPAEDAPVAETTPEEAVEPAPETAPTDEEAPTDEAPVAEQEAAEETPTEEPAPPAESEAPTPTVEASPTAPLAQTEATAPSTPLTLAEISPEQIYAGLPESIAAFFPDSANAAAGEQLALVSGCTACHSFERGVVQIGPSWFDVGEQAVTRVEGQSPALYLYTSIVEPNAHVVEGFQPNLMPPTYEAMFEDEQIANLVAFLLAQRGDN